MQTTIVLHSIIVGTSVYHIDDNYQNPFGINTDFKIQKSIAFAQLYLSHLQTRNERC